MPCALEILTLSTLLVSSIPPFPALCMGERQVVIDVCKLTLGRAHTHRWTGCIGMVVSNKCK